MVKSLAEKVFKAIPIREVRRKKQTKQQSHKNLNHSHLIFKLTAQLSKLASVNETLFIRGSGNCESYQ